MRLKLEEAKARGSTYIYCGEIDVKKGTAKVEMQELPLEDPLGTLTGAENMVTFRTIRYDKNPLIIRGPGAGAAVTAGGAFADILNVVM
jgi:aspartokinase/homoserine dehydrogenase 1